MTDIDERPTTALIRMIDAAPSRQVVAGRRMPVIRGLLVAESIDSLHVPAKHRARLRLDEQNTKPVANPGAHSVG